MFVQEFNNIIHYKFILLYIIHIIFHNIIHYKILYIYIECHKLYNNLYLDIILYTPIEFVVFLTNCTLTLCQNLWHNYFPSEILLFSRNLVLSSLKTCLLIMSLWCKWLRKIAWFNNKNQCSYSKVFCCIMTMNCYFLKSFHWAYFRSKLLLFEVKYYNVVWHYKNISLTFRLSSCACSHILEFPITACLEILWSFIISVKYCSNSITQTKKTSNEVREVKVCHNCLYVLKITLRKLVDFHVLRSVTSEVRLDN